MFTRCPECQTVHTLNASLLADAGGSVRCGNCYQAFNALAFLFDHWPESNSSPTLPGKKSGLPLVGRTDNTGQSTEEPPTSESRQEEDPNRKVWLTVFSMLLVVTLANLAWTFREPLLGNSDIRRYLVDIGALESPVHEPFKDLARLHLVSRDLHNHPTRTGMLALSFTFVNRAGQVQPYPNIEVTLSDASNFPLARREFSPTEYLPAYTSLPAGLAPNVHLPVLLEFADPGANATGFELKFR